MSRWKWVSHEGRRLLNVGVDEDGAIFNPNAYPEDVVRAAIAAAEERRHARRSAAAKRAAETRRRRVERLVYETARRLNAGGVFIPGHACAICGKGLTDRQSKARGIGSDCWQKVLASMEGKAASS